MKNLKRIKRLTWLLAFCATNQVHGQKLYNTAFGFRTGWTSGISVKQNIGNRNYIEGMFGFRPYDANLTLLIETYKNTGTPNLSYYYGGGFHISTYQTRYFYYPRNRKYYDYYLNENMAGIDGILGLEYKLKTAPVTFSMDVKPYIERNSAGYWMTALDPGLAVRFVF